MYIINFENSDLNSFNNAHIFFINNGFVLSTSSNFLEIIINNDIYEIINETHIQHYRKTNVLPDNGDIIKKTIVNNETYVNEEYEYTAIIKNVTITENKLYDNIADLPKQFAMKKRLTYRNEKLKVYYQCEIINHSNQVDIDFRNITLDTKTPKYNYSVISDDRLDVDYHIREMHFILDNNIIPLKKEEQTNVLKSYNNLITSIFSKYSRINLKNNIVIIAPKSITLEKHNLVPIEEYGSTSIFENYAVTEKADGNRYFLYVNENSNVYLIDTATKEVRGCNIKTSLKNCLLDGELILCQDRLINKQRDLFAIFDIYYYNAEKVSTLPLLVEDKTARSRYNLMKEFVEHITHFYSHDIIVKKQLTSNNILQNCHEILFNSETYDYNIDGLIFTPTKLGVFSHYANKPVELNNINNFNWNKVLKWKPPEQNTIDFIVIEKQKHKLSDGKVYKEYILNIVYNNLNMEPMPISSGLKYLKKIEKRTVKNIYTLKPLVIDNIEQTVFIETDTSGKCYTLRNEEILNHSVVEFYYDNLTVLLANKKRWKPLRVRHDKNKVYNFGEGEINKTANSYLVAIGIWRSITNTVSTDIITGKQPIETNIKKYLTGLDTYYTRNISSNNLISNKMNKFHNHIIKDMLYSVDVRKQGGNTKALLELACGQGSDINRWFNNKFKYILGVDYTLDNITNPRAGVYSRYLKGDTDDDSYLSNLNNKTFVFVAGDCSKSLHNGKAAENIDKESRDVLKHIFERPHKDYGHIKDFPRSFQLVSCMFSVHYFFENEDMLNGFVKNVGENLENNGKLILTFMDEALVKKELNNNDGRAVGKDSTSDSTVWAIIRNFNPHQQSKYNQKIDVFIENTGRLISENLVDLKVLVSKLSHYKIDLKQTETFEETFKKKLKEKTIKKGEREILENLNNDENLKRFSFLNRWCIFQKQP